MITLSFKAAVGEPTFSSRIADGINGDIVTCAVALNAVRLVLEVGPGLKSMADLPGLPWFTSR